MRRPASLADSIMPWMGLVIGVVAVAFVHQFGSDSTFDSCANHAPGPVLIAAAIGLVACGLACFASWRSLNGEEGTARRVVAVISIGCSALFALAIIYPMIAALVLPPCFQ